MKGQRKAIGIGLIGWGTVGCGVIQALRDNAQAIRDRLGVPIELRRVADLDLDTRRPVAVDRELLTTDVREILTAPDIDIVIELIGGLEPARTFIATALAGGKHVVTANKALLAHHGNELFELARTSDRSIGFEAAVAGGIPLIKSLREGLAANQVETIFGILNGTANYILSRMTTEPGLSFAAALSAAQAQGYAEADPTLDIEGIDTAHKLAIACAIAFGGPIQFDRVHVEGISGIDPIDLRFAEEFGYRLKLLAIGRHLNGRYEMRVHPTLIPREHVLASVTGAYNAVHIHGNAVGDIMLYGLGAGMMPTGSAVLSDVIDLGRDLLSGIQRRVPPLSFLPESQQPLDYQPITEVTTRYYFRFSAMDRPGVLSAVAGILGRNRISIAAVIQKGRQVEGTVPIVMLTHEARESDVRRSLEEIDQLQVVQAPTRLLRIEGHDPGDSL